MIVVGDIHGKVREFLRLVKFLEKQTPKNDLVVQVGDFGFGFLNLDLFPEIPGNVRILRGNHDDPEEARKHPRYLGDFGSFNLRDTGQKVFFLSGAFSIDWESRIPGRSWWMDEELSMQDLDKAIGLYLEVKPDIVISHECPSDIMHQFTFMRNFKQECGKSRTAIALQHMLNGHCPVQWFFGHHHVSKTIEVNGVAFRCLNELEWARSYRPIITPNQKRKE